MAKTKIVTYEGNTRAIVFRLRKTGTTQYWDVSSASSIFLEGAPAGKGDQEPIGPVQCDKQHPDADWANGKVVAVISPDDFTEEKGTKLFSLTVVIGSETITVDDGSIEVGDRPGYVPP